MPFDYKHTAEDDLLIQGGDFVVAETTLQHQSLITRIEKGELRQFPKTGVGINSYLLDDNTGDAFQELQRQYKADGMIIRKLQVFSDGSINADCYYP
jgi:hypothetical protein